MLSIPATKPLYKGHARHAATYQISKRKVSIDGGEDIRKAVEDVVGVGKANESKAMVYEKKYRAKEREEMAKGGQAMKDGSYPIADEADLKNAVRAVGRGLGDHDAIRRHIIKRAKALKAESSLPDNWKADGSLKESRANESLDPDKEEALVKKLLNAKDVIQIGADEDSESADYLLGIVKKRDFEKEENGYRLYVTKDLSFVSTDDDIPLFFVSADTSQRLGDLVYSANESKYFNRDGTLKLFEDIKD
jgi:hypothetical protein